MSINWNLFRIAARLAAQGDSEPLIKQNKIDYIKKAVKKIQEETGAGPTSDKRRELDSMAQEAAENPEAEDGLPYDKQTLEYIENLRDEYLPDQEQRKYFVLWLADQRKKNPRIDDVDVQNIAHYYTAKGFKQEVLKNKSFNQLRDEAIDFNESATPPVSTKFVPIISLDDLEPEVIDGMIITKVNKSSRSSNPHTDDGAPLDPEDVIENHLKAVGTDMGICIGSVYGKKIAKGEHDAFIMHDASEKPVAAMDLLKSTDRLREIKGRKNQNIEDPRIAIPFLKYILKHFDINQFEETEDFWVPIIIASLGLDSSSFPGLTQDKKDWVDSISELKDGEAKSNRDKVIKAVLRKFEGYSIDDLMQFSNTHQGFRAIVNKVDKKILPDLAHQIIEDDASQPVVDILIRRLKGDLLKLPFDKNIYNIFPMLARELPTYKSLAAEYETHFKTKEAKEALSAIYKSARPGRDLAAKIVEFIDRGLPIIVDFMKSDDIAVTAPYFLEYPGKIQKIIEALPRDLVTKIINYKTKDFSALNGISSMAALKKVLDRHLGYDAEDKTLRDLLAQLPKARPLIIEKTPTHRLPKVLTSIELSDADRKQIYEKFNGDRIINDYWLILIQYTLDQKLAGMGLEGAQRASRRKEIYNAIRGYYYIDETFSGYEDLVKRLLTRMESLPPEKFFTLGMDDKMFSKMNFETSGINSGKTKGDPSFVVIDGKRLNAAALIDGVAYGRIDFSDLGLDVVRKACTILLEKNSSIALSCVKEIMKRYPEPQTIQDMVSLGLNADSPDKFDEIVWNLYLTGSDTIKTVHDQIDWSALDRKCQELGEPKTAKSFLATIKYWSK